MLDIATHRLHSQKLVNTTLTDPTAAVEWLGAVQSQDYMGAKWALAQRTTGLKDDEVEQAFNDGYILRTHVLRPTWHFLTPGDIRWILALTAPHVHQMNGTYYRKFAIDETVISRSRDVFTKALQGQNYQTREQLATLLDGAGIPADGLRLAYIMMHAELEGLICSGPRAGKQFTYALLDERVPAAPPVTLDEALATLTYRYFASHGPATVKDYGLWSLLTMKHIKHGLHLLGDRLNHEAFNGQNYYFVGDIPTPDSHHPVTAYLLPNYDEAMGRSADPSPVIDPRFAQLWDPKRGVLAHYLVIDGRIVGSWQRVFKRDTVVIQLKPFVALTDEQTSAVEAACQRYGTFLGLTPVPEWLPPVL
ncbi:MAG: winged helix DNA-binding domain-containing protein [Chloroflexi bacterium]|nr:winged helix DNA-binding domain-containing protein [Chloroflexota bacterium]MCC6891551.1 AlkZ family DNA glycosylase [Anaerolineae bacterium]